ncbi:putative low temperature requirement A [Roseibium sp. TrichSKD4]|uniref:low temperature requirement protein A n=1 Tax=Roseibium sp. TrichSKD4 TaxID=744980 RepID=UPI0001E56BDE|nr:low temperature requirement protein A [Roseibium sp. TrichSKD4]EFO30158.1 putative low temperature requirement A [Roseibium sp. TrichSKD4]
MALHDHPMWRKPQHHQDLDHVHDHVHWTELFYDLIHVVTIFLLGNYLSHHLDVSGFLIFAGVFIALWYAWGELSVFNSIYVSTDIWHRLIMSAMIVTVMFMAASIPAIGSYGWTYFTVGFAVNRALLAALYFRARRTNATSQSLCAEQTRNFLIFAVLFLISAFLPQPYGYLLFGLTMVATQTVYMVPKISVLRHERFAPRIGHLSERFALLTFIVLGEGFFKLVVTLSEKGIYKVSPDVLVNFVIGGVAMFVMCWIYFDFVGNGKARDTKVKTLVTWWLSHLILMLCGVMVGVALAAEVKVGFWEPYPTKYAAIGCFGLAGYIAMLWDISSTIEHRLAKEFWTAPIRLFGIALAIATFFIVPHVPALVGNLFWGTALFSQIAIPLVRAWRTLSTE